MSSRADTDELKAFVASTLQAIAAGITEAQGTQISSAHGTGVFGFNAPKKVEFDVAVSAKRTGQAGGGLKVAVFGIGANLEGKEGNEDATISRIRFSVRTNFKNTSDPIPLDTTNLRKGMA